MYSLSGKIKRIKALKNGNGLPYLATAGSGILENPVYIHDMAYKLLAHTEQIVTDDPLWNELLANGVYSRPTLELFKTEYFIDAIANAEAITLLASDKLPYGRLLGKIFNGQGILVACANVVSCQRPFTDDDPPVFEVLCQKIAREIGHSEFYQAYGEQSRQTVINELIDGSIEDKRLHSHSVATIYQGLGNYLYIAAADAAPEHFIGTLKRWQPAFKFTVRDGRAVIIFSADDTDPHMSGELQKLQRLAKKHQVNLGVSDHFENLFEARAYYEQACAALRGEAAKVVAPENNA